MSANSELTMTLDHSYLVLLYLFDFDKQIGKVETTAKNKKISLPMGGQFQTLRKFAS